MTGLSLMRLLPPGGKIASGQITLAGRGDITTLSDAEMRKIRGNDIGMVFQDPMTSLDPTMTIGHQIAETVRLHRGGDQKAAMARAAEVLSLVGMPRLAERLDDYPHQLSGGLRQRVMIAIALACEPKVLVADEPTTALDVTIQAQILDLLDDLKDRLGMAIILITHDLGVIAGRADRTMVMYAGRIVEQAETGRLFGAMHHPYTEALLASIPTIDQDPRQVLYSIPGLPPELIRPPACCRFAARCRYVQDRCRTEQPLLDGGSEHEFACFFPTSTDAGDLKATSELFTADGSTADAAGAAPVPASTGSPAARQRHPGKHRLGKHRLGRYRL